MKEYVLAASLALMSMNISAQTQVSQFQPGATANGVTYALPRTVLHIDAYGIKTTFTPGDFARYAERYLHIQNVKQEPEVCYYMQSLSMRMLGRPDTAKIYTVKLKDNTLAPLVRLTDEGVLASVNADFKDEHTEAVPVVPTIKTHHELDGKKYLTEEILSATSLLKMAELTAAEIFEIRESRNALMRGEVDCMPKDGASLEMVIRRLDLQEEALTQLFVGYTDTVSISQSYRVEPLNNQDIENEVVFRFSRKLGFVDSDDLSGVPYYLNLSDTHSVPLPDPQQQARRKIAGLVYNIPSVAKFSIGDGQHTLLSRNVPIAQYGTIDQLAPALFGKGATTQILFNTATGGLQELKR